MKIRRSLFTSVKLWHLVAILGAVVGWSSTAAQAAPPTSTSGVKVVGVVTGGPEVVTFSGRAQINTTLVTDPDFGTPPSVVISLDLSTVGGTGVSTKKNYVISGPEIMIRDLASSDFVDFNFTFLENGEISSVRTGYATFMLDFNVASASITRALIVIRTP
jgi:hypothetical protein